MIQSNFITNVDERACLDVGRTLGVHYNRLIFSILITFLLAFLVFVLFSWFPRASAILSLTTILFVIFSCTILERPAIRMVVDISKNGKKQITWPCLLGISFARVN